MLKSQSCVFMGRMYTLWYDKASCRIHMDILFTPVLWDLKLLWKGFVVLYALFYFDVLFNHTYKMPNS